MPGGWCNVDQSLASNTEKEVREEAGFSVTGERIIAIQDWRKHNVTNYAYGVIKIFVLCRLNGGKFAEFPAIVRRTVCKSYSLQYVSYSFVLLPPV